MIKNHLLDMLARVQNASKKKHLSLIVTFTNLNYSILKILLSENVINGFSLYLDSQNKKQIKVNLKYYGWWLKQPVLINLKKLNTIHQSQFVNLTKMEKILKSNTFKDQIWLMSTSVGILSLKKAFNLKIGGKVLCIIN